MDRNEHELPILIGSDRLILNHGCQVAIGAEQSNACEQSRREKSVWIREDRARVGTDGQSDSLSASACLALCPLDEVRGFVLLALPRRDQPGTWNPISRVRHPRPPWLLP